MKKIHLIVLSILLMTLVSCTSENDHTDQEITLLEAQLFTANESINQLENDLAEQSVLLKSAYNEIKTLEADNLSLYDELGDYKWRTVETENYYLGQIEEYKRLYENHSSYNNLYHSEVVTPLKLDVELYELTLEMADGSTRIFTLDKSCKLLAMGTETWVYNDLDETIEFLKSIINSKRSYTIEILYSFDEKTEIGWIYRVKMN